jgi:hypothetical protein
LLLRENFQAALSLSEDALEHIGELPCTISTLELPESGGLMSLVFLGEDRLYTVLGITLYVYSLSELSSPIATYDLFKSCTTGLIADNYLFLGGGSH